MCLDPGLYVSYQLWKTCSAKGRRVYAGLFGDVVLTEGRALRKNIEPTSLETFKGGSIVFDDIDRSLCRF